MTISPISLAGSVGCGIVLGANAGPTATYTFDAAKSANGRLHLSVQNFVAQVDIEVDSKEVLVEMQMDLDGEEPGTGTESGFARLRAPLGGTASDFVDIRTARLECKVEPA